ncbi:cytochrome P450 [Flammula alnicola]|nr:cytochrome P450 [Flammula alnicola]
MTLEINKTYFLAFVIALLCLPIIRRPTKGLCNIPTMGPSGFLFAIYNSICFLVRGRAMIDEANAQFASFGMFKMQFFSGWNVFVLSKEYIADLRGSRDKDLSLYHAQNDILALDYTIGAVPADEDDLHNKILQRMLASNFSENGVDLYDESVRTLAEIFPVEHDGWHSVTCYKNILHLVTRVTNRFYVGEPLCRDPKYISLVMDFVQGVPKAGMLINLFSYFLRPFVGPYISPLPRYERLATEVIGDILRYRISMFEKHGKNWELKPRDMITWLLEEAEPYQRDPTHIAMRLLRVNFAGLMSTSFFLPQVLYKLAASPEYVGPLREQIDSVVDKYGWTKEGISKMYRIDSFIREVSRLKGFSALVLHRKVMNPEGFKFHDGITIPQGTHIAAASCVVNVNEDTFENSDRFDGLRFARLQEEADDVNMKHQLTSPAMNNLFYGVGKHACPGRFLMTFIIKIQVALILHNYDIKVKDDVLPKDRWLGAICMPDMNAELLYRKRHI